MVGVFVRMKLRVLRNTLHGRQLVAMIFGGLVGLGAAAVTILAGLFPFAHPESSVDVLAAIYAAWLAGWVLAPVATGGGDETLRPEHFALIPIGRRKLAVGLLVATFAGVAAVVMVVACLGLFFYGLRLGPGPAVVGLVFAILQPTLIILLYRVVMAGLGALLSSRKGKELGIVLVALTGLSGVGLNYVISSLGPALVSGRTPEFATVVRVLPSGWGADAVLKAAEGDWGMVALLVAGMVVLLVALLYAWAALLARRTNGTTFRGAARAKAVVTGPKSRSLLPYSPVSAVARKEMWTWWRDARRRTALMSTVLIGLVVSVTPALSGRSARTVPFLGVVVVFFACMQAGNLYGFDGSALWHTLVVPGAERADIRGRQLGWAMIVAPLGLLLAIVLPAVTSAAWAFPWVFGLLPVMLGGGAGVLVLQSVFAAFPLPDAKRNSSPFASGGRPGCARALQQLLIMLLLVVAALPVAVVELIGVLDDQPALQWAGVPLGIALGALFAWWWGRIAQNRLMRRGPELLAAVSKER